MSEFTLQSWKRECTAICSRCSDETDGVCVKLCNQHMFDFYQLYKNVVNAHSVENGQWEVNECSIESSLSMSARLLDIFLGNADSIVAVFVGDFQGFDCPDKPVPMRAFRDASIFIACHTIAVEMVHKVISMRGSIRVMSLKSNYVLSFDLSESISDFFDFEFNLYGCGDNLEALRKVNSIVV